MESWSYVYDGKYGSASTGTISTSSSFPRNSDISRNWELRGPNRAGENVLVSWNQQSVESHCFVELGYGEMVGKQLASDSIKDSFRNKYDGERVLSPILGTPVSYSVEEESTSKLSSSVVDSNSRDSSFIDLKLGRFVDNKDAASHFNKGNHLSSADSSTPPKKLRVGVSNFRIAHCQVYGCNKDLSSSKDYHKRHKVCEAHSKTAKVIVNGIEQRFCQQCSRFHLLAEFDDGKRSCRKRLAGHNERRRKPQVGNHYVRAGKLLPTYAGPIGSSFQVIPTTTSFVCHDILPRGPLYPEKYVADDWCRRIKSEDVTDISILSAIPSTAEQHPNSKSIVPPSDYEKLFPQFNEQGPNNAAEYVFGEQGNRYHPYFGGTASGPRSLIQDTVGSEEDFSILNAAPTMHELPGITDSGRALSLLSSQSQNSPSQSSRIPLALPLALSESDNHCRQASSSRMSNRFSSLQLNPTAGGGHLSPIMISDGNDDAEFSITDGIYQSLEHFTTNDRLSCGDDGQTIDLLQLSSQLQRVEQQRKSMSLKQENDAFC